MVSGNWFSGEALATHLGLTRAAVWKRIRRLRELGYAIEAEKGRGYRLMAFSDRLLPEEIRRSSQARRFASHLHTFEEVDSTSVVAARLAREGAPEGTAVLAERQTAGRGRFGRSWSSPSHKNLYLSLVLRPDLAPTSVAQITLVAAVAVARAIVAAAPELDPRIKWPNDLLLGERKTAGILTELDAEVDRVRFVVLGIGVNLNAEVEDFPQELRDKATSLKLCCGRDIQRAAFTGRLLGELESLYEEFLRAGFVALRAEYEGRHGYVGRRVRVSGAGDPSGVVRGIDDSGALLLETADGVRRIVAGEVTLEGNYAA